MYDYAQHLSAIYRQVELCTSRKEAKELLRQADRLQQQRDLDEMYPLQHSTEQ
jgi:hypothetical protein